jgi:hypothetical protein
VCRYSGWQVLIANSTLRTAQTRLAEEHQKELEHLRKTLEANAERIRQRGEAETADLRSNIKKLEADIIKVRNTYTFIPYAIITIENRRTKTTFRIFKLRMRNTHRIVKNWLYVCSAPKRRRQTSKQE